MASKTVIVGSRVGLHARPASIIAQAASGYDDEITLCRPGEDPVDAASALFIMTLGAGNGASVIVESDNAQAVEEIASLIEKDLDAE